MLDYLPLKASFTSANEAFPSYGPLSSAGFMFKRYIARKKKKRKQMLFTEGMKLSHYTKSEVKKDIDVQIPTINKSLEPISTANRNALSNLEYLKPDLEFLNQI